jgi:hypothetical protein
MAKQLEVAGTERKTIKEVTDSAENYREQRDKRMKMSKKEREAKVALIGAMRKHKVEIYKDDTCVPPITVIVSTKDDVKVESKTHEDPPEDEG